MNQKKAAICRMIFSVSVDDSSGTVVTLDPVTVFHAFDTNLGAGTRGMEEVVVAEIDTYMGEGATHGVEENQITGLQLGGVDTLADLAHFGSGAGQLGAEAVFEHQTNKAAAIETAIFVIATKPVTDANQLESLQDHVLRGVGVALEKGWLLLFAFADLFGRYGREAG